MYNCVSHFFPRKLFSPAVLFDINDGGFTELRLINWIIVGNSIHYLKCTLPCFYTIRYWGIVPPHPPPLEGLLSIAQMNTPQPFNIEA